ncbi:MAG: sigma-54-dependent transcriptional regulator [Lacipirellulaceae bacterium]
MLVIDDDPLVYVLVRRALQGLPHRFFTAPDGRTGVAEVEARQPDLIVLDNVLPDGLGVRALERIHQLAPSVPVLFVTARGSGGTAIEAMKLCAFDYLPKPLDPARLRQQIDRALELRRLVRSNTPSGDTAPKTTAPATSVLIGECPPMQAVFKAIGKVAMQDVAVLVQGEHGAGKESVAREIHRHSRRADGPLVKLACRGLDDARVEELLFGKAASDNTAATPGRIEAAAGGTLVLQEVGGLSLPMQSKLLQALRDGTYEPSGGTTVPVRCRIVAITSEDLEQKSRAAEFRSDLFYTLSSFVITLPPLRMRHGDLPLLVRHSLDKLAPIAREFGVERAAVSDEAMRTLASHVWPGNIDELESVLKRALVEQKGNILLGSELFGAAPGPAVPVATSGSGSKYLTDWSAFTALRIDAGGDTLHADAVAETERKVFARLLVHTRGNQAQAARILGITRASLRKKLRQYGMASKPSAE